MGRPSKGWRLKPQPGTRVLAVAWTDPPAPGETKGKPRQQSTGERDPRRAAKVAAKIYSAAIRGGPTESHSARRRSNDDLGLKAEQWLAARKDLDEQTVATYALYFETHLAPYFARLADVSPESVRSYSAQRLSKVSASTVRHELSALRMLVRWALPNEDADQIVPTLAKGTRGTSHEASTGQRRRGQPTELSEAETLAIISKLPEWSRTPRNGKTSDRYPIRARFVFKYETGLRESLIDNLSVPEHWDPAKPEELRIEPKIDKMRYGRTVPLTPAAQTALSSTLVRKGLLFGSHDYRNAITKAARAAGLPEHRVKTLAPNDLRHARATHIGAKPEATLNAMMFMFGWTQPSTAARYMHPTGEAMKAMISSAQTVSGPEATTISSTEARPVDAGRNGTSIKDASSGRTDSLTIPKAAPVSRGAEPTPTAKPCPDDEPFGFG